MTFSHINERTSLGEMLYLFLDHERDRSMDKLHKRQRMDRKMTEYLISGKSQRFIIKNLEVGRNRVKKVRQLAEQKGYLSGTPLPAFPEAPFPDRQDVRNEKKVPTGSILVPMMAQIQERIESGWSLITSFEELGPAVSFATFYRFLVRHNILKGSLKPRS